MKNKLLYWIPTALVALIFLGSAYANLSGQETMRVAYTHLGYPTSLMAFLGVCKLLGVIALLVPGFRGLKEWAYAGFTYDLLGAAYAHLSVDDPAPKVVMPLVFLLIVLLSRVFVDRVRFAGVSGPNSAG